MNKETFTFYRFDGIYLHRLNGNSEIKKISLKTCFEKYFSTSYDDNTKKLFNHRDFKFDAKEKTLEQIKILIVEGFVFFPISETMERKIVQNYMDYGFIPMFMKVTEYRRLKKALIDDN